MGSLDTLTDGERAAFYAAAAKDILASPKYAPFGIPIETLMNLFEQEGGNHRDRKSLIKVVRQKLHNIMAPYLEDLDYDLAGQWLEQMDPHDDQALKDTCARIMCAHASTRERLPILQDFYEAIFQKIGKPRAILDLACGLHPFSIPWMGLSNDVAYYAYDIHRPRIVLINKFFSMIGMQPLAEVRDVLVDPPQQPADAALIYKEAHRMEQRKRGCSRALWQQLAVRYLLVSLPASSLSGQHDLTTRHRQMVNKIIMDFPWRVSEISLRGELIFVIDKKNG